MWEFHDGIGWWMLFGGMGMIVFWTVIIGLVVRSVTRVAGGRETRGEQRQSPIDIVKRGLARGEITRDEFEDLERTWQ